MGGVKRKVSALMRGLRITFVKRRSVVCPKCLSLDHEWAKLSGRGTIWSFIVVHRPQHPAFFGDVPYNVAIVELDEGIRLHTNVVECATFTTAMRSFGSASLKFGLSR